MGSHVAFVKGSRQMGSQDNKKKKEKERKTSFSGLIALPSRRPPSLSPLAGHLLLLSPSSPLVSLAATGRQTLTKQSIPSPTGSEISSPPLAVSPAVAAAVPSFSPSPGRHHRSASFNSDSHLHQQQPPEQQPSTVPTNDSLVARSAIGEGDRSNGQKNFPESHPTLLNRSATEEEGERSKSKQI